MVTVESLSRRYCPHFQRHPAAALLFFSLTSVQQQPFIRRAQHHPNSQPRVYVSPSGKRANGRRAWQCWEERSPAFQGCRPATTGCISFILGRAPASLLRYYLPRSRNCRLTDTRSGLLSARSSAASARRLRQRAAPGGGEAGQPRKLLQ